MHNIRIFAKTYWQHARNIFDLIFFIVSFIALFFRAQTSLATPVGLAMIFMIILVAAYRTWLYQYNQTQQLFELYGKKIEYSGLNNVQKSILSGMNTEIDKKIISISSIAGVIFKGIGDAGNKYDMDEIGAEIVELAKMDILRVDAYNKSGRPIYKPTSLGFKILKQSGSQ